MNKNKKVWSVVLLCAEILLAVFLALLIIFGGALMVDGADSVDTKVEALGWLLVLSAILMLLPQLCLFFGALGLALSIANVKISESKAIKGISIGFIVLFSLVLLIGLIIGLCWTIVFIT